MSRYCDGERDYRPPEPPSRLSLGSRSAWHETVRQLSDSARHEADPRARGRRYDALIDALSREPG